MSDAITTTLRTLEGLLREHRNAEGVAEIVRDQAPRLRLTVTGAATDVLPVHLHLTGEMAETVRALLPAIATAAVEAKAAEIRAALERLGQSFAPLNP